MKDEQLQILQEIRGKLNKMMDSRLWTDSSLAASLVYDWAGNYLDDLLNTVERENITNHREIIERVRAAAGEMHLRARETKEKGEHYKKLAEQEQQETN